MDARGTDLKGGRGELQRARTACGLNKMLCIGFATAFLLLPFRIAQPSESKPIHLTENSWRKFPYRFEIVNKLLGSAQYRIVLVDYDDDGVSEWLDSIDPDFSQQKRPLSQVTFELRDAKRNDLWLFNLLGSLWINGYMLDDVWPDVPGKELVVSFGHGDSLCLAIYNPSEEGRYLKKFLLLTKPVIRRSRRGLAWLGRAEPALIADLDRDGRKEILFRLSTTYSLYPRGFLAFSPVLGRTLWRYDTGVQVLDPSIFLRDLDGDGPLEIVTGSDAPANGARVNGTDDFHSYLIVLSADSGKPLLVKRFGGRFSTLRVLDVDSQGGRIYFARMEGKGGAGNQSFLGVLAYPDTGTVRKIPLHSGGSVFPWDMDADGEKEFLVTRNWQRDITLFDRDFSVIRRRRFVYRSAASPKIETVVDVDRDFRPELVLELDNRVTLLDPAFRPVAQFPVDRSRFVGLFHERPDKPPQILLVTDRPDGSRIYYLTRLKRQFVWPLPISWQGTLLLIFGFVMLGAGVSVGRKIRSRDTTISTLQRALEFVPYGVTLLDRDGVITLCNTSARELLSLEDMVVEKRHFTSVLSDETMAPLRRALEDSLAGKEQRYRHRLTLQLPSGRTQQLVITVTRILDRQGNEAGRMAILYDPSRCSEGLQKENWISIARRVAHEIKNPLSTILLTIQRLQMEYRRRDPVGTSVYDPFTERIIGRVEYLEKVTQGFLKLLRLENPHFVSCDLEELVSKVVREFELGIPDNVKLAYRSEQPLPNIVADPDQVRSLVENLLANAVAAMPDGGVLTVSLQLERHLQTSGDHHRSARDFVLLRVRDTGFGMSKEIATALMNGETDEKGDILGIGLTIVARVVRIHEGFIDVLAESGVGTTVDVYLPA